MNLEDIPDESDTSDEDYIPNSKQEDAVSEIDSDGDIEEPLSGAEEDNSNKVDRKRRKKTTKSRKKMKKSEPEIEPTQENSTEQSNVTEEEKKKKEEDIWADFMKDTGFQSKSSKNNIARDTPKPSCTASKNNKTLEPKSSKPPEKVKITQIFEFAGEEVTVEKEVSADSAEARLLNKNIPETTKSKPKTKGGLSGISNVLSQLGKKPKISTLEKSKLDWDKFKKEENIEEELQTFNKGKDGYLERQDFLQRADLRQFEIEREIRAVERSKRLNNAL